MWNKSALENPPESKMTIILYSAEISHINVDVAFTINENGKLWCVLCLYDKDDIKVEWEYIIIDYQFWAYAPTEVQNEMHSLYGP